MDLMANYNEKQIKTGNLTGRGSSQNRETRWIPGDVS